MFFLWSIFFLLFFAYGLIYDLSSSMFIVDSLYFVFSVFLWGPYFCFFLPIVLFTICLLLSISLFLLCYLSNFASYLSAIGVNFHFSSQLFSQSIGQLISAVCQSLGESSVSQSVCIYLLLHIH